MARGLKDFDNMRKFDKSERMDEGMGKNEARMRLLTRNLGGTMRKYLML